MTLSIVFIADAVTSLVIFNNHNDFLHVHMLTTCYWCTDLLDNNDSEIFIKFNLTCSIKTEFGMVQKSSLTPKIKQPILTENNNNN